MIRTAAIILLCLPPTQLDALSTNWLPQQGSTSLTTMRVSLFDQQQDSTDTSQWGLHVLGKSKLSSEEDLRQEHGIQKTTVDPVEPPSRRWSSVSIQPNPTRAKLGEPEGGHTKSEKWHLFHMFRKGGRDIIDGQEDGRRNELKKPTQIQPTAPKQDVRRQTPSYRDNSSDDEGWHFFRIFRKGKGTDDEKARLWKEDQQNRIPSDGSNQAEAKTVQQIATVGTDLGNKAEGAVAPKTNTLPSTDLGPNKRVQDVTFVSPLLEYGYPPAVKDALDSTMSKKPLLLYLPGFDGTFLCPFLQFPELSTLFDVRCLTVTMKDRSKYEDLKQTVISYLSDDSDDECTEEGPKAILNVFGKSKQRPIYIAGESFGGILGSDVALELMKQGLNLKGLVLINAATCYDRSRLASEGPAVAHLPGALYVPGLLKMLHMFADEYSVGQLFQILQAKGLPSVIDTPAREAYMGRVAFSLPRILKFMPQTTLEWRLREWLTIGCERMASRIVEFEKYPDLRTLVVAGEKDLALPSIAEAERLASTLRNCQVHVVEGAGHSSTCGSRLDLAAAMRNRFHELKGRREMKKEAAQGLGVNFGLEPRYDGNDIGLNPLLYWSKNYYQKYPGTTRSTKTQGASR